MNRKTPSNIPGARQMIGEALDQLYQQQEVLDAAIAKLEQARALMWRANADKVTKTRHPQLTRQQKQEIKRLRDETDMSEQQIAVQVGTNAGRVSEVVNGLR